MSSTVSLHLRKLLMELAFNSDIAAAPPANLYLALTYDVAASNAPGLLISEPLIGGYVRQTYPLDSTHWQSSGFGEVLNTQLITFPEATLDWGLMMGWALLDTLAAGTGNTWASGSLVTPTYVEAGRTIAVVPRAMAIGIYD